MISVPPKNPAYVRVLERVFNLLGVTPIRRFPFVRLYRAKKEIPYQAPEGPMSHLDDEFMVPVKMIVQDADVEADAKRIYEIWKNIPGGYKWLHYFPIYQSLLGMYAEFPIRMLEIGIYKGGSIQMWREFLHPDSVIVGIDIDEACRSFEDKSANVFVRIGDQSDRVFLNQLVDEFGPFNVILDDGSHQCRHMIESFNGLFLDGLADNGLYIAEDTHTNFWPNHRESSYSFLDLCKDLVDIMHAHYVDYHHAHFFRKNHPDRISSMLVPRVCTEIEEIQFYDSIVVIRKRKRDLPVTIHL